MVINLQGISIINGILNVSLSIFLFNNYKTRMDADFYITRLSSDMKIAVGKNHLGGQILHRSLDPRNNLEQSCRPLYCTGIPRKGSNTFRRAFDNTLSNFFSKFFPFSAGIDTNLISEFFIFLILNFLLKIM